MKAWAGLPARASLADAGSIPGGRCGRVVASTLFRDRPLDAGPYRYLWIDALTQKVREGGRVLNVSAVVATSVTAEGRGEIVGFDVFTSETTDSWTEFLRGLVQRGLSGVELVISDAHGGIKAAIGQVLGGASWQRCRTHFMANLAGRSPKGNWPMIAALIRQVFEQPDRDAIWDQFAVVVDRLTEAGFHGVAPTPDESGDRCAPIRPSGAGGDDARGRLLGGTCGRSPRAYYRAGAKCGSRSLECLYVARTPLAGVTHEGSKHFPCAVDSVLLASHPGKDAGGQSSAPNIRASRRFVYRRPVRATFTVERTALTFRGRSTVWRRLASGCQQ